MFFLNKRSNFEKKPQELSYISNNNEVYLLILNFWTRLSYVFPESVQKGDQKGRQIIIYEIYNFKNYTSSLYILKNVCLK